jgi:hypothetical protein
MSNYNIFEYNIPDKIDIEKIEKIVAESKNMQEELEFKQEIHERVI